MLMALMHIFFLSYVKPNWACLRQGFYTKIINFHAKKWKREGFLLLQLEEPIKPERPGQKTNLVVARFVG